MLTPALRAAARPTALRTAALPARRYASHGPPAYNEPSGYLFGERPPKKGEKRKWQPWEPVFYFGFFGAMAFGIVTQIYRPDTTIQTWAMNEAKARMEARGEKYKYEPKDYPKFRPQGEAGTESHAV
ncbi:hypothetical protein IAT38_004415 [Cryptococcus sp. DSM 104549]